MEPSGKTKLYSALGTGALLVGALAYIGIADPHQPGSVFPPCPFKLLTGWNCPACGGLRMTHDLLHGDLAAAVMDNVFLLVGLPLLAVGCCGGCAVASGCFRSTGGVIIVVTAVAWTVIRNLPGFPLVPTILDG